MIKGNKISMNKISLLLSSVLFFMVTVLHAQNKLVRIIPQPAEVSLNQGQFQLKSSLTVYANDVNLYKLVDYSTRILNKDLGILAEVSSDMKASNALRFVLDASFKDKIGGSYRLDVDQHGVTIISATEQGLFYGFQTFRQLLVTNGSSKTIPCVLINDTPRFAWRAFMLDEGRYFKGKKQVIKLLDEMARLSN